MAPRQGLWITVGGMKLAFRLGRVGPMRGLVVRTREASVARGRSSRAGWPDPPAIPASTRTADHQAIDQRSEDSDVDSN
jgi:hypothetical protein